MRKIFVLLLLTFISVSVTAQDNSNLFKTAELLSKRNVAINNTLKSYPGQAGEKLSKKDEAEFKYLITAGESAGLCALLSANIVGANGIMNKNQRKEYLEMLSLSLNECKASVEFKLRDLVAISKSRGADFIGRLAADLVNQFQLLKRELNI